MATPLVSILSYGLGNVGSFSNALNILSIEHNIISSPNCLSKANRLIIPGVGKFDDAVSRLKSARLYDDLIDFAITYNRPILGVCLGMHLLCQSSEEGSSPGLGLFDATVSLNKTSSCLPSCHLGWNIANDQLGTFPLANKRQEDFYFLHSYGLHDHGPAQTYLITTYSHTFISAFQKDNLFGVQFHPEKSGVAGLGLLKKFSQI